MLLGILIPSLRKAKQLAAEKICSHNLRQIFLNISVYAYDNNDFFPLTPTEHNDPHNINIPNPDDRSHRSLLLKLGVYEEGNLDVFYCPKASMLEKFASNSNEYIPNNATDSVINTSENNELGNIGYVYWRFIENKYSTSGPWRNPAKFIPRQLKTTGVKWLYPDRPKRKGLSSEIWVLSDFFRKGAPFPHGRESSEGLNMCYLDGHVNLLKGKPKDSYR